MVMMWSVPATVSMLATSLAEIGARLYEGACSTVRLSPSLYFVLAILSSVREAWNDRGNARCRGDFTRVDHDQELHEVVVDLAAATLHDEHIFTTYGFVDFDAKTHARTHDVLP